MADEAAKLKLEIAPDSIHGDPTNIQDAEEKSPTDIFADLSKLRRESVLSRKILTTTVTVGKPSPNVYFRCHPDQCLDRVYVVKGDKGSNDYYYPAPVILKSPWLVRRLRPVTIALTYIWPSGEIGLWPVPDPPRDTTVKAWKSARTAYEKSKTEWVQLIWNEEKMDFDVMPPDGELPAPTWPENLNLSEKLMIGFEGRVIDSDTHPYMLQLRATELTGLPVDTGIIGDLTEQWLPLKLHYINKLDDFDLYDEEGHFHDNRIEDLIKKKRWLNWPRTVTGKLELNSKVIGKQVRYHPELRHLQQLRDQIAELRLGTFVNTIGVDGFSRCPLMPFWTRSGRNQPQGRNKAFLPSLPAWVLGVVRPPQGWGIAELDWSCQEIGFSAAFSGDLGMIDDFNSGDFHTMFAVRSSLAPPGSTKKSLGGVFRRNVKAISFGACYGMTKYGAAAKTGKSLLWAADILARHAHTYPVFARWQQSVSCTAIFDQQIVSPFGWPMAVHANTKRRTLYNFLQQAGGADCLRIAMIAGHEAGIRICAPVHDAVWIMAPINELDDAIATMIQFMERASVAVTGGLRIPVEVSAKMLWPNCLGDVRDPEDKGQEMWAEVMELLYGSLVAGRKGSV
jgi:hypothetical protein